MALFIIKRKNEIEFRKAKNKDINRNLFTSKGRVYSAYPNQFVPMHIHEYGVDCGTEDVIVYQENCMHSQQSIGDESDRGE